MIQWKDINGYEGLYQISSDGQVRSIDRDTVVMWRGRSVVKRVPARMMKLQEDSDGYYSVGLTRQGKQRSFRVNRLVADAFLCNPCNLPIVHHKDNDKKNNCVTNLEWVTVAENTQHAVDTGRLTFDRGRLASISTLGTRKTKKAVRCIETHRVYDSISSCASAEGCYNDRLVRCIHEGLPVNGKHFQFVNTEASPDTPVVCVTSATRYLSAKEAERVLGLPHGSVYRSIKFGRAIEGMVFAYDE